MMLKNHVEETLTKISNTMYKNLWKSLKLKINCQLLVAFLTHGRFVQTTFSPLSLQPS